MKDYDLFISHSYKDRSSLFQLKALLNALNLNVYLDWVNDKDELLRNKTCAETAAVITERIKASKAILYVHSKSSLESKWTPWELGFAFAIGKKVCVLQTDEAELPEYLGLYDKSKITEKSIIVLSGSKEKDIMEWIHN